MHALLAWRQVRNLRFSWDNLSQRDTGLIYCKYIDTSYAVLNKWMTVAVDEFWFSQMEFTYSIRWNYNMHLIFRNCALVSKPFFNLFIVFCYFYVLQGEMAMYELDNANEALLAKQVRKETRHVFLCICWLIGFKYHSHHSHISNRAHVQLWWLHMQSTWWCYILPNYGHNVTFTSLLALHDPNFWKKNRWQSQTQTLN